MRAVIPASAAGLHCGVVVKPLLTSPARLLGTRRVIPVSAEQPGSVTRGAYGGLVLPLPRITGREVVHALTRLGWTVAVQRGSHAQLEHPDRGGRVTVPVYAGETIGPGLLRSIPHQAGVSVDEFRDVL